MISKTPWTIEDSAKIISADGDVVAEDYTFKNMDDFEAIPEAINNSRMAEDGAKSASSARPHGTAVAGTLRARLQMIGDYDEESKTYAVLLLADEDEVDFDEFHDGDEVEISKNSSNGLCESASSQQTAQNADFARLIMVHKHKYEYALKNEKHGTTRMEMYARINALEKLIESAKKSNLIDKHFDT